MSMHQEVACRYPTGHLQATRAAQHHDHGRRRVRLWLSTASRRPCRRLWATRGLLGRVVVAGAAHPVWTAGHLWGVSCPPTMGTPRVRARTRARPQHRGAISCAPAMDGPALERRAGQAPAPCRGRALRGRGKDCVRTPVEGAAHTGGWVNPLSGCAHRGRVALARQLSPRPVACCCPQRLAPLCATDTRHACGTFQLTHGAPRPT